MIDPKIIVKYLDNASHKHFSDMGIMRFGKELFPDIFHSKFGPHHEQMVQLFFQLLDPTRERALDRQAYTLIHREAAKTTFFSFLVPMYLIYLKGHYPILKIMNEGWEGGDGVNNYKIVTDYKIDESFIIIASETLPQSEGFITNIKRILEEREDLMMLFGEKTPIAIKAEGRQVERKWTKTAFITKDNTAVWGVGTGQCIRGRQINNKRPSLVIVDDMYSANNTASSQSLDKAKKWFYADLVNSLDSYKGKVLWLGTLVHPDIVQQEMKYSTYWFGIERALISNADLHKALSLFKQSDGELLLTKSNIDSKKQELLKMQKTMTSLSWADNKNLHWIVSKYASEADKENGTVRFYQEYMNMYVPPENEAITLESFYQCNIEYEFVKGNRLMVKFIYDNKRWEGIVNVGLGLDTASSLSTSADDNALFVAGYVKAFPMIEGISKEQIFELFPDGKVFPIILHIEAGKYDLFKESNRPSLADAILDCYRRFKLKNITIEASGGKEMLIRSIQKFLRDNGCNTPITAEYVSTDKAERIMSIIKPLIQRYGVFICQKNKLINTLFIQLVTLGISKHDDLPDGLAKCFVNITIPSDAKQLIQSRYIHVQTKLQTVHQRLDRNSWKTM